MTAAEKKAPGEVFEEFLPVEKKLVFVTLTIAIILLAAFLYFIYFIFPPPPTENPFKVAIGGLVTVKLFRKKVKKL